MRVGGLKRTTGRISARTLRRVCELDDVVHCSRSLAYRTVRTTATNFYTAYG
jgi:hypothetical protein